MTNKRPLPPAFFYDYSMTLRVLSMTGFHLLFLDRTVNQGRVQFFMAQKLLHLLDWHPSGQQIRGNRPPEPMRMRLFDSGPLAKLPEHVLNPGH